MKKLTAILVITLLALTTFAQGNLRVHAGPVFSYIQANENIGSFSKVHAGFTAGLGYEFAAARNFSVQPELNYAHMKFSETTADADYTLNYLQVPILLKAVSKMRNFSFYVGPQLAFLTTGNKKVGGVKSEVKDNLTQTDVSAVIGIEYILPVNVSLNARFNHGFSDVFKQVFDSPYKSRLEIVSFTVGYVFARKGE